MQYRLVRTAWGTSSCYASAMPLLSLPASHRRQQLHRLRSACSPGPAGREEEAGSQSSACTRSLSAESSLMSFAFTLLSFLLPALEGAAEGPGAGAGCGAGARRGAGAGWGAPTGAGAGLLALSSLGAGLGLLALRSLGAGEGLLERRAGAATAAQHTASSSAARSKRILAALPRWVSARRGCLRAGAAEHSARQVAASPPAGERCYDARQPAGA